MEMHLTETLATVSLLNEQYPVLVRTRVPGGWLYQTFLYKALGSGGVTPSMNTTFVPYHTEDLENPDTSKEVGDGLA